MVNPAKLVEALNQNCKNLLSGVFCLKQFGGQSSTLTVYRNEGVSLAINRFENPIEQVKVQNFFDDFWLFMEIRFVYDRSEEKQAGLKINTYLSISIFQGEQNDDNKNQLFRAEWDDHRNPLEIHAQPHWHATSNLAMERTFDEYSSVFDNGDFITMLKNEKSKIVDLSKLHFAMNGNWYNDSTHIHEIEDEKQMVKWLQGLLSHIRTELQ
jgi:hypothetical protein